MEAPVLRPVEVFAKGITAPEVPCNPYGVLFQ
jgi:hypothetical protein